MVEGAVLMVAGVAVMLRCWPVLVAVLIAANMPQVPLLVQIGVLPALAMLCTTGAGLLGGGGVGGVWRLVAADPRRLGRFLMGYGLMVATLIIIVTLPKAAVKILGPLGVGAVWFSVPLGVIALRSWFVLPQALAEDDISLVRAWCVARGRMMEVLGALFLFFVALIVIIVISHAVWTRSGGSGPFGASAVVTVLCLVAAFIGAVLALAHTGSREPQSAVGPQIGRFGGGSWAEVFAAIRVLGRSWLLLFGAVAIAVLIPPPFWFDNAAMPGPAPGGWWRFASAHILLALPLAMAVTARVLCSGWVEVFRLLHREPSRLGQFVVAYAFLTALPLLVFGSMAVIQRIIPPSSSAGAFTGVIGIALTVPLALLALRLSILLPQAMSGAALDTVAAWQAGRGKLLWLIGMHFRFGLLLFPMIVIMMLGATGKIAAHHPPQLEHTAALWVVAIGRIQHILVISFHSAIIARLYADALLSPAGGREERHHAQ